MNLGPGDILIHHDGFDVVLIHPVTKKVYDSFCEEILTRFRQSPLEFIEKYIAKTQARDPGLCQKNPPCLMLDRFQEHGDKYWYGVIVYIDHLGTYKYSHWLGNGMSIPKDVYDKV